MSVYTLANPNDLEQELVARLHSPANLASWSQFSSGELFVSVTQVTSSVVVIGRTHPPHSHIFATLLLLDTLRRHGAQDITLVLPYLGYARQDRLSQPGDAISSALLLQQLAAAGASRIITCSLHSPRLHNLSPIPLIDISLGSSLPAAIQALQTGQHVCLIAPDNGGLTSVKQIAEHCPNPHTLAWISKTRQRHGPVMAKSLQISGAYSDIGIIFDDMLDTGGTIKEAAQILRERGITRLSLAVTHGIFSGQAIDLVNSLDFNQVLVANTYPLPSSHQRIHNLTIIPAQAALEQAVRQSISIPAH